MTPDQRQRTLNRADPQDPSAALRLLTERSRVEGDGVWLELLSDRAAWNAQPPETQDAAIAVVVQRLGSGYELVGVRVWECENRAIDREQTSKNEAYILSVVNDVCAADAREFNRLLETRVVTDTTTISHRLATFKHVATGMELNLLPGVVVDVSAEWYKAAFASMGALNDRDDPDEAQRIMAARKRCIKPLLMGRYPVTEGQVYKADKGATLVDLLARDQDHVAAAEALESLGEPAAELLGSSCVREAGQDIESTLLESLDFPCLSVNCSHGDYS